jgi:Tfp pilus assembly protein FimT
MNTSPLVPSASTMRRRRVVRDRIRAGFSTVELVVVLGIIAVAAGVAMVAMPGAVLTAKSDSGATRVMSVLRAVREEAISQRRNIRVAFTDPNRIVVSRVEVPGPGTTVINTVLLEDGIRFLKFDGVPDTPDAFGNATATSFGAATTIAFTSEGQLIDQHGDPINGTVLLGRYNDPNTARAVTIFGPTALIRQWRWDGRAWTN